jgi:hypothetical protein
MVLEGNSGVLEVQDFRYLKDLIPFHMNAELSQSIRMKEN